MSLVSLPLTQAASTVVLSGPCAALQGNNVKHPAISRTAGAEQVQVTQSGGKSIQCHTLCSIDTGSALNDMP